MSLAMASLFGNTVASRSSESQRSFAGVPSSPSSSRSTCPANRLPKLVIMRGLPRARPPGSAVEAARVLAGHLVGDVGGQVLELLVDVLLRLRPHPVGVRVVGAPHQGLDAHLVDELGAHPIVLEGGL